MSDGPSPWGTATTKHWWHFLLLVALVSLAESARLLLEGTSGFPASLLFYSMYTWLPALCGIALAVNHPDDRTTRAGVSLGVAGVLLMVGLDLCSSVLPAGLAESGFRASDASITPMRQDEQAASFSWILAAKDWLGGNLVVPDQLTTSYDLGHPRLRAVEAVGEAGLLLLVFASIGFVIAANSWIRAHVLFKRDQDRLAAQIVVAWLLAPLLTGIAADLTSAQRFQVLFRGGAIWRPAVPYVVLLVLAVVAWRWTARYRSPAEP